MMLLRAFGVLWLFKCGSESLFPQIKLAVEASKRVYGDRSVVMPSPTDDIDGFVCVTAAESDRDIEQSTVPDEEYINLSVVKGDEKGPVELIGESNTSHVAGDDINTGGSNEKNDGAAGINSDENNDDNESIKSNESHEDTSSIKSNEGESIALNDKSNGGGELYVNNIEESKSDDGYNPYDYECKYPHSDNQHAPIYPWRYKTIDSQEDLESISLESAHLTNRRDRNGEFEPSVHQMHQRSSDGELESSSVHSMNPEDYEECMNRVIEMDRRRRMTNMQLSLMFMLEQEVVMWLVNEFYHENREFPRRHLDDYFCDLFKSLFTSVSRCAVSFLVAVSQQLQCGEFLCGFDEGNYDDNGEEFVRDGSSNGGRYKERTE